MFSTFCLASSIPSFHSVVKFPGFDLYGRIKKIVVGFVGMWIPRSGIQVIVGSEGKAEDFSMLSRVKMEGTLVQIQLKPNRTI
jgi:hypothetical protein